jgi:hypothetical protein
MIKLRTRANAIITASILTMGSAFGMTLETAAPAQGHNV